MSNTQSIVSPEEQNVTFVELFFDLIFVFSVTQIVGLLHHDLNWQGVGQSVLVFWLVWWAWTQFTWALNAADTTHPLVELGTLLATAIAFLMAVALPEAYRDRSLLFASAYVLVRVVGLGIYIWVAWSNTKHLAIVTRFALLSIGGLVAALLGGFLGGALQYWLWGATILLDVIAANFGAQDESWNLHPEHFGERHGLFVIIALGETLIVAAGVVSGAEWSRELMIVGGLAVALTCALWWTYFTRTKPALDRALETAHGAQQAMLGRDLFSLMHFPMLCGVIAYAVVIEEAVAHPNEALGLAARLVLAAGLVLFVGGMALAVRRASGQVLWPRLALIVGAAVIVVVLASVAPLWTFAISLATVTLVAGVEQRTAWLEPDETLVAEG